MPWISTRAPPGAHEALAEHLSALGWFDEGISEATTALELDPLCLTTRAEVAGRYYLARRFEETTRLARQILALEPAFAYARLLLGTSLLERGDRHEAVTELERFRAQSPQDPLALAVVGCARARLGETAAALSLVHELEGVRCRRYVSADRIAVVYAGLGDKTRSLQWLETALEERSSSLTILGVHPAFDDLRSDQHFQDLVRRIGLPSADLRPASTGRGPTGSGGGAPPAP